VPGPEIRVLTTTERRRLLKAEARVKSARASLDEARRQWAAVVREVSAAAAARELGITRQAVADRLKAAERSTEA
jgi:hypothetical protein